MLLESTNLSIINNFSGPGMLWLFTILDFINDAFSDRETHWVAINQSFIKTKHQLLLLTDILY